MDNAGMIRQPQTEPMSFRVPQKLKRRLERAARADRRTLTSYILHRLEAAVEKDEGGKS